MQQTSFTKQLKVDSMPRERPLQKSMLLPESQIHPSSPSARPNPLQFSVYTPMKKSLVSTQDNAPSNLPFNNFSFSPQGNFPQNSNMGSTYESRISVQTEPAHQSYTLKSLLSPVKNDFKSEQSPQDYPRMYSKHDKSGMLGSEARQAQSLAASTEALVQEVVSQLKEKHLPSLLSKLKKQIYDDIHNVRLEFQALREEVRSTLKRQDGAIGDLKFSHPASYSGNNPVVRQKDEEVAELQTHYFLLENKLSQIEARLSQNSKALSQQFEKLSHKVENELKVHPMKVSPIRSSLSPIMLEYKESFTIKKNSLFRPKEEEEIVFNHCVYFIDKFGYLMDSENRYLTDGHGIQIRLEDRHIRILESHKIFEK